jgi:hypothetical protein
MSFRCSKEQCHVSNCNVISWNRPFQYYPYLEQYIQLAQASSQPLHGGNDKKNVKQTFASVQSATLFKYYNGTHFQQ